MVKTALEEQGHTLIEFKTSGMSEALTSAYTILNSGGQFRDYTEKALQGEKPLEERARMLKQAQLSNAFKANLI